MSIPKNRVCKLNPAHEDLPTFGSYSLNSLRFDPMQLNASILIPSTTADMLYKTGGGAKYGLKNAN
jgi:hypothetical protein